MILFLTVNSLILGASASRLLLLPGPHRSHVHSFSIVARGLQDSGHVVDVLTVENRKSLVERNNIKPLLLKYNAIKLIDDPSAFENVVLTSGENILKLISRMTMAVSELCEALFADDAMMSIMQSNNYDLVIVDGIDYSRCLYALPYRLGVKYITLSVKHDPWNAGLPAIPSVEHLPLIGNIITEDSTLFDRLKSLFMYTFIFMSLPRPVLNDSVILQHAPGKPPMTYQELFQNSEMWLIKLEMMCLDWPRIYGNHYQFVSGIGLEAPKPLSADLEQFIQDSNGVIVQSFGTAIQDIPADILNKMLEAYSRVDYHVILRHTGQLPADIPDNVKVMSWLPQADLLGHPRTKVFITHGGHNGQMEALHHGVPMIVIPFFADQFHNAERITRKGFGLSLNRHTFTAEELTDAINHVTTSQMQHNIKHCSDIFHSFPPANETILFWVNHVIRFGGAHLKPVALKVPIWKFFMFDILGILIVLILCVYTCTLCLLNKCYTKYRNQANSNTMKKTQ